MLFNVRHFRASALPKAFAALALATLTLGACDDDDPTEPDPEIWEAEVVGVGEYEDVVGAAAAAVGGSVTAAQIEIDDGPADAVFDWTLAEGTCEEPGTALGTAANYGEIETDGQGAGEAEATISVALQQDEDYIVLVRESEGEDSAVAACGELIHD